jgi:hypothetical protein
VTRALASYTRRCLIHLWTRALFGAVGPGDAARVPQGVRLLDSSLARQTVASLWLMGLYGKPDRPGSGFFPRAARS